MNSLALVPHSQPYRPVRALDRGLRILQAINQIGSGTLSHICDATNLPYATVVRLVNTLMEAGFVEKEHGRKYYRPTAMVKSLASGMDTSADLVEAARPHIEDLTNKLGWPISITTRVGNKMVLQDSTHRMTSLTFSNYAPGYTLPIAECATGKVCLAFSGGEERTLIQRRFEMSDDPGDRAGLLLTEYGSLIKQIRQQGFATQARNSCTSSPGKTSSIAVPIMSDGVLVGAMAIIFFSVGMKMAEAELRFVDELKVAAQKIARQLQHGQMPLV